MTKQEEISVAKELSTSFTNINSAYRGNVTSYLEVAKKCADAYNLADDNNFDITDMIDSLTMSKTTFYRFVKIGNADLIGVYGKEMLNKVSDYNILEMLSSDKLMKKDSQSAKNKVDAIKSLISSKTEVFNRDTVKKIVSGATDTSKNSNIDTKRFNKVVASIRVNSQSFVSLDDITALNRLITKICKDNDYDFEVAVETKDVQKSLEASVKEFQKFNEVYSARFNSERKVA